MQKRKLFSSILLVCLCFWISIVSANTTYKTGEYTGEAKGYGGYIKVALTVDESGKISDVKILGDKETPDIGGYALEEFPSWILEAQSAEIDTYSGATFTSKGVKEATQAAIEQAIVNESVPKTAYKAGEYTGEAKGYGGYITVTLTVDESGKISNVKILGDKETPDIGGYALQEFPTWILEAQSAEIDTYSGATFTSKGVKEATQAAIDQAVDNKSASKTAYKAGEYTGEAKGYGGYIKVTLTIDESGKISDVKILGDKETPDIGGYALEEFPSWILEAQSAEIDTYSGATFTSKGVKEATQAAIEQAK